MSADLLPAIVAAARRAAGERERSVPIGSLERRMSVRTPRGADFQRALVQPGLNIIAECKRRSPSRGVLRQDYDPVAVASAYSRGGAAAISVLTEPTFFDGSLEHLQAVRQAVDLPLLRKDFIVTRHQVAEARVAGADAVLLIVAALESAALAELLSYAQSLDLAVLVEVHDENELKEAIDAGATIIGVNSRNLRSMNVTPATFETLAPRIPDDVVAIAESGLRTAADIARLRALRYNAFLVGERLVTAPDPGGALEVLQAGATEEGLR